MEKVELLEVITFLEAYVRQHFREEEDLMQAGNYPQIEDHRKLHAIFSQLVADVRFEVSHRGPSLSLSVAVEKKLRDWFAAHVLVQDRKFVSFVK